LPKRWFGLTGVCGAAIGTLVGVVLIAHQLLSSQFRQRTAVDVITQPARKIHDGSHLGGPAVLAPTESSLFALGEESIKSSRTQAISQVVLAKVQNGDFEGASKVVALLDRQPDRDAVRRVLADAILPPPSVDDLTKYYFDQQGGRRVVVDRLNSVFGLTKQIEDDSVLVRLLARIAIIGHALDQFAPGDPALGFSIRDLLTTATSRAARIQDVDNDRQNQPWFWPIVLTASLTVLGFITSNLASSMLENFGKVVSDRILKQWDVASEISNPSEVHASVAESSSPSLMQARITPTQRQGSTAVGAGGDILESHKVDSI